MSVNKPKIRVSKAARELNVGAQTIINFLQDNGFDLGENPSPNSKLSDDAYKKLLKKYQPDKLTKEETSKVSLPGKKSTKETEKAEGDKEASSDRVNQKVKELTEQKELEAKKAAEAAKKEAEEARKRAVALEKERLQKAEQERKEREAKAKELAEEQKQKEIEQQKANAESSNTTAAPEEKAPTKGGFKVLGTLDLDGFDKRGKKGQKKKAASNKNTAQKQTAKDDKPKGTPKADTDKEKAAESKQADTTKGDATKESPKVDKADAAKEAPQGKKATKDSGTDKPSSSDKDKPKTAASADATKDAKPKEADAKQTEAAEKPEETSKTPDKKGLTILGKIDVEQFSSKKSKKKPVATSSDHGQKKRRKRKRIKKDETPGQSAQGASSGNKEQQKSKQGSKPANKKPQRSKRKEQPQDSEIDKKVIQEQIKATMSKLSGKSPSAQRSKIRRKKRDEIRTRQQHEEETKQQQSKVLQVTEFITLNELANLLEVNVTELITACMNLGLMVSINQRIDAETITILAEEFDHEVEFKEANMDEPSLEEEDTPENMKDRAPIVTIMGHVDHGKTSLLDYIRKSNIIKGESGGITQHIGAYEVEFNGKNIAFLDTPGHEAFTAMRARGAKLTDIAIIVISCDDSVMPQTREAISHAKAANVPIVFAFNKIDREGANPDKIKEQLADMDILVEEWGGPYQSQNISAKKGLHIEELLEKVLLEAELLELKADANKRAVGTVVEASLDRGKGIVVNTLVQSGTLHIGDPILAGAHFGKVKAMFDERGNRVQKAGPSAPVQVLGFDGAPQAGDKFYVTENDSVAKSVANERQQLIREQGRRTKKHVTLDEIGRRLAIGNFKELNIIIKGDVDGSIEAIADALQKLSTDEVQVNVIHKAVGQISESDVLLASASDAIIIGFQVRPSPNARRLAENEQIDIRLYSVIYDAIEEVKTAMEGMLTPGTEEEIKANLEVRDVFKVKKVGTVAGCMVLEGKIHRNDRVRLIRDGVVIYTGDLASLKRFKDDVKEVASGYECGVGIEKFNDVKVGDNIEAFREIEVKRSL